ncbi:MAG TPA: hypothetical protein VIS72_08175, partial [Anaerolineales bacterium]
YVFGKTLDIAISYGSTNGISTGVSWQWAFFTLAAGSLLGVIFALLLHHRLVIQNTNTHKTIEDHEEGEPK